MSALELAKDTLDTRGQSYWYALSLLKQGSLNTATPISELLKQNLSNILTKAICMSKISDLRPTKSGYELRIRQEDTFPNLWAEFSQGEDCQAFFDLMYVAGEPLVFAEVLRRSNVRRFAMLEALDDDHPNSPLTICLLKLHATRLVDSETTNVPNHLQFKLRSVSEITEKENLHCIPSAWMTA